MDEKSEQSIKERVEPYNWLNKYNIPFDELVFSKYKAEECIQRGISIMIEDKPKNIIKCAKNNIKTICYHSSYNSNINTNNVFRCFSWYDIYNFLCKNPPF